MPQIRKNRTWCKTCQDWELFSVEIPADGEKSKPLCDTCKSEYIPYSQDEVPEDKLVEQRERYSKMKFEEFKRMVGVYAQSNPLSEIFKPDTEIGLHITEDDAGEIAIQEAKKAARDAKRLADIELKDKFRGAQRNSPCRCESGLKYKKCCLPIIEKLR
jgi:hypothetical protein